MSTEAITKAELTRDGVDHSLGSPVSKGKQWWAVAGRIGRYLGFWALILGLLGLNGFWLWEARSLTDLKTIARWIDDGRTSDAERALSAFLRQTPHHGDARTILARVLAIQGKLADCASQLQQVPFWWPTKSEALFREGQAWMQVDRAQDAEAAWRQYISEDPNHPEVKQFQRRVEVDVINLMALEDRWDEAREVIWKAFERAEPSAREDLLVMSLRSYLERSSPAASAPVLRKYMAADPTDGNARRALARQAQALGLTDEADENIKHFLKNNPKDPLVWRDWLGILQSRGDSLAIEKALAEAPPEADSNAEILAEKALVYTRSGDLEKASQTYRQAIARRGFEPNYYYRLALLEQQSGHPEDAKSHLARFQELQAARDRLAAELDALFDDHQSGNSTRDQLRSRYSRLSQTCLVLGLKRDADGWASLLSKMEPPPLQGS
jgi:tetratricopeptide (TPR) repeat protein